MTAAPARCAHRHTPSLSWAWVLLGLLLLGGCSARGLTPQASTAPVLSADMAEATWQHYRTYTSAREAAHGPFSLRFSLRYTDEAQEGRRVTAVAWGNGDLPLRLDVMAGVGALVGRVRQAADSLIIHSPRENRAWSHQGNGKALLAFGVPIPLTMPDFVDIMQGRFAAVFGTVYDGLPVAGLKDTLVYTLPAGSSLPGLLTLDTRGLPVRWQERGQGKNGWTMTIAYDEDESPPLPALITIDHPEGRQAILSIKERQVPAAPFTATQLGLELPQGTPVEPLRRGRRGGE